MKIGQSIAERVVISRMTVHNIAVCGEIYLQNARYNCKMTYSNFNNLVMTSG